VGAKYKQSPIGIARHAWCNKPDTKFQAKGLYHTGLVLDLADPKAQTFKAEIDAEVERAWAEEVELAKLKPADAKKWGKYYPYEVENDADTGEATGKIIFKFKQNAVIPLKDGGEKNFVLGIRDIHNKETDAKVFGGATIRVLYKPRNVKLATAKQFGVRLDFCMVQLIKAAPMTGGGFDEVDEAYTGGQDGPAGDEY
jgi:hypothetical protein